MRVRRLLALLVMTLTALLTTGASARAASAPISGAGSSWAVSAVDEWRYALGTHPPYTQFYYASTGSRDGRDGFASRSLDFAITELSYAEAAGPGASATTLPSRNYTYVPVVAGGLALAYDLHVNGRPLTGLQLSSRTLALLFTNRITRWDDPALQADNPGLALPSTQVRTLVRRDDSHTSRALASYLADEQHAVWDAYCASLRLPVSCGATGEWPYGRGNQQQIQGSFGMRGFLEQSTGEGSIGYVESSVVRDIAHFETPLTTAALQNAAGRYTVPTERAESLAVRSAIFDESPDPEQRVADLRAVQRSPDPEAYPLSDLAYAVVPTSTASLTADRASTLGVILGYAVCSGQQLAGYRGYAPLPRPAVVAALREVARIPGAHAPSLADCANPTLGPGGTDALGPTPAPTAVLPEVQAPLLLLVGAGLVGVVVLRRRRRTVSACATTASASAPR